MARIVSDLILADNVIDDGEIAKFGNLFSGDCRELFLEAQTLTFAEALKRFALPGSNPWKILTQGRNIQKIADETAGSDGFCAPAEALLTLAVDYYLLRNNRGYTKYEILSFPITDFPIGEHFVLYVDKKAGPTRDQVEQKRDALTNLLASIGFQFIHIPTIAKQFKSKGLESFKAMSIYLFPNIPADGIEDTYNEIISMKTDKFVSDYLKKKLGFGIDCSRPSLLVMLGHTCRLGNNISDKGLAYETYANFLKIDIGDDDPVDIVNKLVSDYNKLVAINVALNFNPAMDKIQYSGFYKAFFRLVALAKGCPTLYNINISTTLHAIFFNKRALNLPAGKAAVYALILCRSFFGDKRGLPTGKQHSKLSDEEKAQIQSQYEQVYSLIKGRQKSKLADLYPAAQNRISDIKNAIKGIVGDSLISVVQITEKDGYIKTIIDPKRITVDDIPITEHPTWSGIVTNLA